MSVQTAVDQRTAKLKEVLEDSNAALLSQGGTSAAALSGIPDKIRALTVSAAEYPVMELSEEYKSYVEYCRANLYTGDYAHLVVWDSGEWIAVSFLMSDFTIQSYDLYTTELTATGWVTCGYTVSTGAWTVHDYTSEESPGGNYARYIVFASCQIKYGNQTLFPVGITAEIKTTNVAYDEETSTITLTFETGQTETLTVVYDDSGNPVGVEFGSGHSTTITGVTLSNAE